MCAAAKKTRGGESVENQPKGLKRRVTSHEKKKSQNLGRQTKKKKR